MFMPEFQVLKLEIPEQKEHFMLARRNSSTPSGMALLPYESWKNKKAKHYSALTHF